MMGMQWASVYLTDYGRIELPFRAAEQANEWYRAVVTRDWFLYGHKVKAEIQLIEDKEVEDELVPEKIFVD